MTQGNSWLYDRLRDDLDEAITAYRNMTSASRRGSLAEFRRAAASLDKTLAMVWRGKRWGICEGLCDVWLDKDKRADYWKWVQAYIRRAGVGYTRLTQAKAVTKAMRTAARQAQAGVGCGQEC